MNMQQITPLEQLEGMAEGLRARLKSLDIQTVEDLIARHTAMNDISALANALGIREEELEAMIKEAKKTLPEDVLERLTTAPPKDEMPLGALDPEDLPESDDPDT